MARHWVDSHFGSEGVEFGTDFGPGLSRPGDDHHEDWVRPVFAGDIDTSPVDFGLDPLTLGILAAGALAGTAATTHHVLATHAILRSHQAARRGQHSSASAPIALTDSDGEMEALNAAEASDPAALRG